MRTLIVADPWDIHARAVAWGLEQAGEESPVLYTHDFPQKSAISIHLDSGQTRSGNAVAVEFSCARHYRPTALEDADAVWLRRWYQPIASPDLHPADSKFSQTESGEFMRATMHMLDERERFWVNPLQAKLRADRKPVQLSNARDVGLRIPRTLFSNDPEQIRSFFKGNGGRAIYKPLTAACWISEEKSHATFTSVLSEDLLRHDASLANAPGIYQEFLDKDFELRVTVIGRSVFAARLDSQKDGYYLTDWRANQLDSEIQCDMFELPADIEHKCMALMDRLGLVFGCIDIVVTPRGEYVFLEVNEMGQFIWIEDMNPEMPLLDCFVKFLISRDPKFRYKADSPVCDFREFRTWMDTQVDFEPDSARHIPIPRSYEMRE
jgi:glutathione synthase/RimK-type ligase-like ATP-grasp enzyme